MKATAVRLETAEKHKIGRIFFRDVESRTVGEHPLPAEGFYEQNAMSLGDLQKRHEQIGACQQAMPQTFFPRDGVVPHDIVYSEGTDVVLSGLHC